MQDGIKALEQVGNASQRWYGWFLGLVREIGHVDVAGSFRQRFPVRKQKFRHVDPSTKCKPIQALAQRRVETNTQFLQLGLQILKQNRCRRKCRSRNAHTVGDGQKYIILGRCHLGSVDILGRMRLPDDLRQFVKGRALIGSVAIRLFNPIGGIVTTGVVKNGLWAPQSVDDWHQLGWQRPRMVTRLGLVQQRQPARRPTQPLRPRRQIRRRW